MGNSKSGQKKSESYTTSKSSVGAVGASAKSEADAVAIISTNFSKDYSLKREIGSGYTAKCYMCQAKKGKQFYACKVVDKNKLKMKSGRGPKLIKRLMDEIQILKSVRHPNIVQVHKVYENGNKVFIVMELMKGGELFDHIIERGCLVETEAIAIVRKLCDAICYLHKKDILHRDIKPENILLKKPSDINEIRIIDFGMSKVFEKTRHKSLARASSLLGTPGYMAPEIMKSESYSKAVDMWSIGVVTYVLLCGYMPFDETHGIKTRWAMDFPDAEWDAISADAREFVTGLLTVDPRKRLTAEGALKHRWLSPAANVSNTPLPSPRRLRGSAKKQRFTFDDEELAMGAAESASAEDDPVKKKLDMPS